MRQDDLVEFIRFKLGMRSEAELAKALGQTPAAFSQRKIRGTIDVVEIRDLLKSRRIDPSTLDKFLADHTGGKSVDDNHQQNFRDYRQVPEYNVRVSAGHGEYLGIEHVRQELQIPKQWLPENGKIGLVKVEGDSMWPTINHGDFVAVEFGSGYTSDGLYLVRVEDSAYVKRLQKEFGSIRIISDNPQYREMTVSPDDGNDFGLIGRVALIVRKT